MKHFIILCVVVIILGQNVKSNPVVPDTLKQCSPFNCFCIEASPGEYDENGCQISCGPCKIPEPVQCPAIACLCGTEPRGQNGIVHCPICKPCEVPEPLQCPEIACLCAEGEYDENGCQISCGPCKIPEPVQCPAIACLCGREPRSQNGIVRCPICKPCEVPEPVICPAILCACVSALPGEHDADGCAISCGPCSDPVQSLLA